MAHLTAYTVGLTGISIALLRSQPDLSLTRKFIFNVILPPLILKAALTLRWSELRRDLLSVLVLATIIVLVLLARADTVYAICLPFARSGWAIPLRAQHILWWGRLRGALCLALDTATTLSPRPIIQIAALHSAASAGKPSGS